MIRDHLNEQNELLAGFVLYRLDNGVVEYLLLKKVEQNDWSPPKGFIIPKKPDVHRRVELNFKNKLILFENLFFVKLLSNLKYHLIRSCGKWRGLF